MKVEIIFLKVRACHEWNTHSC